MGVASTFTFTSDTETVTRTKLNNLVANLLTEFNGNIDNSNIKSAAAIAYSKLNLTGSISLGDMAANSVDSDQYVDGSIDAVHLASNAVTTVKILDNNVTSAKLEDDLAFGTFPTTPEAEPDADYEVTNKKYVDDSPKASLGDYDLGISGSNTEALTDGFVVAYAPITGATLLEGFTDASSTPTTLIVTCSSAVSADRQCFTMPVKKGNYWRVEGSTVVNWIPLGT